LKFVFKKRIRARLIYYYFHRLPVRNVSARSRTYPRTMARKSTAGPWFLHQDFEWQEYIH